MMTKEENILWHAEKIFAQKGFEAASTREISRAAGVNISMISYYFGSKERLYEKIFEMRMNEGSELGREILSNENLDEYKKICAIVLAYIRRVATYRDFYRILHAEQTTNKNGRIMRFMQNSKLAYLNIYQTLLESGVKKGIFTKSPRVELIHASIVGTVFYGFISLPLYREYSGTGQDEDVFFVKFYTDLEEHIQLLLKNLLGYEET